jgi:hypothetical protein
VVAWVGGEHGPDSIPDETTSHELINIHSTNSAIHNTDSTRLG